MIKLKIFKYNGDNNDMESIINGFISDKDIIKIETTVHGYTDRIYIYYKLCTRDNSERVKFNDRC